MQFSSLVDQFYPEVVESCRINGKLYMAPFHYSTDILFYNRDWFAQAAERYHLHQLSTSAAHRVLGHLGLDITRTYRIHPDVVFGVFQSCRLGQTQHAMLRRDIG